MVGRRSVSSLPFNREFAFTEMLMQFIRHAATALDIRGYYDLHWHWFRIWIPLIRRICAVLMQTSVIVRNRHCSDANNSIQGGPMKDATKATNYEN